jgi:hypothetical protein
MVKNEHVSYEWQMLQACYHVLQKLNKGMMIPLMISGGEQANGQFFFNMVHEDFCLHARNLINWKHSLEYDVMGYDFTLASIMKKVEDQIVTLDVERRTAKVEEKISDYDRKFLYEYIKEFME